MNDNVVITHKYLDVYSNLHTPAAYKNLTLICCHFCHSTSVPLFNMLVNRVRDIGEIYNPVSLLLCGKN